MRSSLLLAALVVTAAFTSAGCASCTSGLGQRALGLIEGPINDPSNRSLRRSILSWGLDVFCKEMLRRNAPLKLVEESPVIGRYYPSQCTQSELDGGDLVVTFQGRGYAYTNLSKKLAFASGGTVRYDQDFKMDGSTMYAHFRSKEVRAAAFNVIAIEQPLANLMNQINPVADKFGKQLLDQKIAEGFTVIREPNGEADFSMGILNVGQRPMHPFAVHGDAKIVYENLRTEVHQNERDFIGPIEVEDSGRALFVTAKVEGAGAMDVLLMAADAGAAALDAYLSQPNVGPMAPPVASEVLSPDAELRKTWPVPKGRYYVVIDHTPYAGATNPPANLLDDRAGVVSYAVQIGDAP
ncbi:MAG: hypothetical protein IPG50_19950 [Myxococcales bacterium]|nr:hypothetical protein [Myxococcales bacterium]